MTIVDVFGLLEARNLRLERENSVYEESSHSSSEPEVKQPGEFYIDELAQIFK